MKPPDTPGSAEKFRPGDRVVRVTHDGAVPEGVKGVVLGRAGYPFKDKWEVEYEGHPSAIGAASYPWLRSKTSWISREEAIELTTEQALERVKEIS